MRGALAFVEATALAEVVDKEFNSTYGDITHAILNHSRPIPLPES